MDSHPSLSLGSAALSDSPPAVHEAAPEETEAARRPPTQAPKGVTHAPPDAPVPATEVPGRKPAGRGGKGFYKPVVQIHPSKQQLLQSQAPAEAGPRPVVVLPTQAAAVVSKAGRGPKNTRGGPARK